MAVRQEDGAGQKEVLGGARMEKGKPFSLPLFV